MDRFPEFLPESIERDCEIMRCDVPNRNQRQLSAAHMAEKAVL